MENRYFIIDFGEDLEGIAKEIIQKMGNTPNFHYVTYKTDLPNGFMITETTESDFLLHFAYKTTENE